LLSDSVTQRVGLSDTDTDVRSPCKVLSKASYSAEPLLSCQLAYSLFLAASRA
jgi:hypothetical protein